MNVHQIVRIAQAKTSDHWREAVRERWRTTLLSAWERDATSAEGGLTACSKKGAFLRQKPRMNRNLALCK